LIESQSSNCDDDEDFKPQNNKKSSVIKLDKEKLNNTELTCSDKITEKIGTNEIKWIHSIMKCTTKRNKNEGHAIQVTT
jgi:hypothetical protein